MFAESPSDSPVVRAEGLVVRRKDVNEARRDLADLAALSIVLAGGSAIDSSALYLSNRAAVENFLRLHQFDTDNPLDLDRLYELCNESIDYLTDTHGYRLPPAVAQVSDIHELFLLAANGGPGVQPFACITLKVMQILHHLASREIVFGTAISEADLLGRLNGRVFRTIDEMRSTGIELEEFSTGKKTRSSMVTKLLSKRGALATHIFDKLRFRMVLRNRNDLVRALLFLLRNLVPFNYVVPGESQNGLINLQDLQRVLGLPSKIILDHFDQSGGEPLQLSPTPRNEFSGSTFRCVNLVADIPLRIDDVAPQKSPAIAVVQAEIQLVDTTTNAKNNEGENAHSAYKKRQRGVVQRRLQGPDWPTECDEKQSN